MDLARALSGHRPADPAEAADLRRIREFVARHAHPFDRRIVEGHLTGSALVVSATGDGVLLLRHRKLQRWLQPGGHADAGETAGETVALREAGEETGIAGLALHPSAPRPLDVDVHQIPAREGEPAHLHFDLRYLVVAPAGQRGALDDAKHAASASRLSRRQRPARAAERFLRRLASDSLRRVALDDAERVAERAAFAENDDLRWFGWEELGRLDLDPGLRRALGKAQVCLGVAPSGPRRRRGRSRGRG